MSAATITLDPRDCAVNGVPLHSLTMTADTEVIESLSPIPDPSWGFTDADGHLHAWADHPTRPNPWLPTLTATRVESECDGSCGPNGCDGFTMRIDYTCKLCGQPVEPSYVQGPHRLRGETTYSAVLAGPGELASMHGKEVCLTWPGHFAYGPLYVGELVMDAFGSRAEASMPLARYHRRAGSTAQLFLSARRANLARAMLAGAEAVRKPWESLTEGERGEFAHDFAALAATRAITAALPHLGLDADGGPL